MERGLTDVERTLQNERICSSYLKVSNENELTVYTTSTTF